jgi:hypothetical protein
MYFLNLYLTISCCLQSVGYYFLFQKSTSKFEELTDRLRQYGIKVLPVRIVHVPRLCNIISPYYHSSVRVIVTSACQLFVK